MESQLYTNMSGIDYCLVGPVCAVQHPWYWLSPFLDNVVMCCERQFVCAVYMVETRDLVGLL